MTAYGYDFHQTMIAKIEAAQRPLRVRELADFGALYGVEVQELVYPPTGSLSETAEDIAEATARLDMAKAQAAKARDQLEAAREAMHQAQKAYEVSTAEAAVLEGRLATLQATRQKLLSWESDADPFLAAGSNKTERNVPEPTVTSIASAAGGPTVLRILLGAQLRRVREAKQITVEDAAGVIRASHSKINRLEAGRVGFKERDVVDLLAMYGVDEGERDALVALARRANAPGWWHDYSDILPSWFEAYIGLEEAATQIRVYEVQFVPGLLQTEDYARAVMLRGHDSAPTREIERRVRLRIARQVLLDRPNPPGLRVVLDEAVLRRQVGDPAMMRDQLKHLAAMAERPNVTMQMLPFQASGSSAEGSFSILRYPGSDLPDIVYLEQLRSAMYLDKAEEVNSYLRAMQHLSSQALTSSETTQFVGQLLKQPLSA
jgi:transcriptional regulator with XRE-family HTH domain